MRALWIEIQRQLKNWTFSYVEARESLVDWNSQFHEPQKVVYRRGSWEPCGLKFTKETVYQPANYVEARESLVDWNLIQRSFQGQASCRGSWEPCGLKLCSESVAVNLVNVEARESLVDWNHIQKYVDAMRESRGSWEPCGLKSNPVGAYAILLLSRLVRALWIEIPPLHFVW